MRCLSVTYVSERGRCPDYHRVHPQFIHEYAVSDQTHIANLDYSLAEKDTDCRILAPATTSAPLSHSCMERS